MCPFWLVSSCAYDIHGYVYVLTHVLHRKQVSTSSTKDSTYVITSSIYIEYVSGYLLHGHGDCIYKIMRRFYPMQINKLLFTNPKIANECYGN